MPSLMSQLIVSLIDRVSGPAKGAGAALKGLGNIEKQLQSQLKSGASNYNWGKTFSAEIGKLKLSAKELDAVAKDFERFQQRLRSGAQRMRASEYVGAMDAWKTRTLSNIRAVRAAAEEAERARERMFKGWRGGARFAAGALGVGGAAYTVNRGARASVTATAGNLREGARDYLAGLSPAETARLKARSLGLSAQYPSVDMQTMHQSLRETAMSMRSVDKASELGETLAQGLVVLQSLKGKDEALKESAKFFSALDTLGKNLDPGEVKQLYDGYLKALGVEGVDLNLADLKMIAQKSKSAGPGLSNRFLMMTAPGLQGDIGASRLGTALGSEVAQIIGDRATKKSKAAQAEFGLRDKNGWKDQRKIMTDPDKFAWENLIPALKKKGIDPDDIPGVTKAMNQIFSNQMVSDLFTKLITQREQYQAKSAQYEAAPGLGAADKLRANDPFVALEGMMGQLRNAASTLAEGPMQKAVGMLNGLTDAIARMTDTLAKNPELASKAGLATGAAAVAGGAGAIALARKTYQWFTGSGSSAAGAAAGDVAGGAATASRWGIMGRLLGRAALAPNWSGGRVMDSPEMMQALQNWRSRQSLPKDEPGYWGDGASGFMPGKSIWTDGTSPIQHLDASGQASSAGAKTGEAYKSAIDTALQGVDAKIQAAVQRWIGMLTFSAHPTITPNISAPAGQKSGALETTKAKQHAMFADYGFNTV